MDKTWLARSSTILTPNSAREKEESRLDLVFRTKAWDDCARGYVVCYAAADAAKHLERLLLNDIASSDKAAVLRVKHTRSIRIRRRRGVYSIEVEMLDMPKEICKQQRKAAA